MVHSYHDCEQYFAPHSNFLLTPRCQVIWGMVCSLFAVVHSPGGLIAIRFFLGFAEAGFLPGLVFWRTSSHYVLM